MSTIASDVVSARRRLTSRFVEELGRDARVEAVWLGGSSGRGEDDALSDIDVAVVFNAGGGSLVKERVQIAARAGPLVAHLDSPHNAPIDGGQLNALYDVSPLPIFVDWNFWPTTRERPSDVTVLVEQTDGFVVSNRSYEAIQRALPRGTPPDRDDPGYLDHFRFMMIPVVAKYAARGWHDSAVGLLHVMQEPEPDALDLATVLDALGRLLDRLAPSESMEAVTCVRTYLERVADVVD